MQYNSREASALQALLSITVVQDGCDNLVASQTWCVGEQCLPSRGRLQPWKPLLLSSLSHSRGKLYVALQVTAARAHSFIERYWLTL